MPARGLQRVERGPVGLGGEADLDAVLFFVLGQRNTGISPTVGLFGRFLGWKLPQQDAEDNRPDAAL